MRDPTATASKRTRNDNVHDLKEGEITNLDFTLSTMKAVKVKAWAQYDI